MADQDTKKLTKKLQALYATEPRVRAFLDHLAQRGKNPKNGYSSVEQVLNELDDQATHADARSVLEQLADAGCGEFKVGRRGWPTRLDWSLDAIVAGKVAKGEPIDVEASKDGGLAPNMTEVDFPLRDDLVVTLVLPKDLSEKEAERLSTFLRSLPK